MIIDKLETTVTFNSESDSLKQTADTNHQTKPNKKRLVAQWAVDANSKLYCRWTTQD